MRLELWVCDRGDVTSHGLPLRDVYLRLASNSGYETLLHACDVTLGHVGKVERAAKLIPGCKVVTQPDPGAPDGTRSEVAATADADGDDDGRDTDLYEPEHGEPVG